MNFYFCLVHLRKSESQGRANSIAVRLSHFLHNQGILHKPWAWRRRRYVIFILRCASPHIRESKTVLNFRFHATDSGVRIPGTGFQSLSVELGFWTPIVCGIPDSFSLRCRCNLTPVSNVCEAAPKSLFWASNRVERITRNAFRISFQTDWQICWWLFR